MLYFRANYDDKNDIAALGAKWDFKTFCWRVDDRADYKKFASWLGGKVFSDTLYFLEAKTVCPYCGKSVKTAAVACGEYFEDGKVYGSGCVNIMSGLEKSGEAVSSWLRKNYSVKNRYFPAYGRKYLANGCPHCGGILSDDYLFNGENSPFFADSAQRAEKLKIFEAHSDFDRVFGGFVRWSFPLENFAKCEFLRIDLGL